MSETIHSEVQHGISRIVLNRPQALNAFDEEMGGAFLEALARAQVPEVRCVIVTGEGRAFCAGEDLRALSDEYRAGRAPDLGDILRRRYNPMIESIVSLQKPVIAALNGVVAGAGVSLALACDYRIIAEGGSLILAFSKVGLVPDSGATWLLARYLGIGRALELAFSTDAVPAARALELGLVSRVVPAAEVERASRELAEELVKGPTIAFGLIKRLIWEAGSAQLAVHLEAEAQAQTAAGASADHLEGVAAFFEKRSPDFRGL